MCDRKKVADKDQWVLVREKRKYKEKQRGGGIGDERKKGYKMLD